MLFGACRTTKEKTARCKIRYVHLFGVLGIEILETQHWLKLKECSGKTKEVSVFKEKGGNLGKLFGMKWD